MGTFSGQIILNSCAGLPIEFLFFCLFCSRKATRQAAVNQEIRPRQEERPTFEEADDRLTRAFYNTLLDTPDRPMFNTPERMVGEVEIDEYNLDE